MRLVDFLDKGASVHPIDAPCLTMAGQARSYADVQRLSWSVGRALARSGIRPGDKVAVLSGNDPVAFGAGVRHQPGRGGLVPGQPPQRGGREPRAARAARLPLPDLRRRLRPAGREDRAGPARADHAGLPGRHAERRRRRGARPSRVPAARSGSPTWLAGVGDDPWQADPVDDVVMIAGTGGTTGKPKGVMLTGRNVETMAALTLMSYPFEGSPVYLAFAPLTHAAGVLCFPIMALGGEIVIMPHPDLGEFLALIGRAPGHPRVPAPDRHLLAARPPGAGVGRPGLAAVPVVRGRADVGRPA